MIRWEYHAYLFERDEKILDRLNKFGAQGWEAFQFWNLGPGGTRVLFKRPIEPTTTGESK